MAVNKALSPQTLNAVEFAGVSLRLGNRTVLADVSLEIPVNAFIGVLGPNGSGKTTLMRAILGLVAPSSGDIRVLGRPATRGNPAIGYIPQVHGASPGLRLSGWDFVGIGAKGHCLGLPRLGKAER
ncbi:MAG TPA: ATP-binding cassette domain-containing protein, partial [Methylovirgula sp.]